MKSTSYNFNNLNYVHIKSISMAKSSILNYRLQGKPVIILQANKYNKSYKSILQVNLKSQSYFMRQ